MKTLKKSIFQKLHRLTASSEVFPASRQAWPGSGEVRMMNGGSGRNSPVPFARFDRSSSSLKTSQDSLPWMEDDVSRKSCPTWPRAGLMSSGQCFPLPPLVRGTGANDSGLLPTPSTKDHYGPNLKSPDSQSGHGLAALVKYFPTPTASMMSVNDMEQARYSGNGGKRPKYAELYPTPIASDWRSGKSSEKTRQKNARPLREVIDAESLENPPNDGLPNTPGETGQPHGTLCPRFVEFLQGLPTGWTELED